jgi:hypothetical protein
LFVVWFQIVYKVLHDQDDQLNESLDDNRNISMKIIFRHLLLLVAVVVGGLGGW